MKPRFLWLAPWLALACASCSDSAGTKDPNTADGGGSGNPNPSPDAGHDWSVFSSGTEVRVTVPESGRAYVRFDPPGAVQVSGDPKASTDWDLALEQYDVYTNGGASGTGRGSAFGPIDAPSYSAATPPQVPLMFTDKTGGAFVKWYAYDGDTHVLYSRYHVAGIQDGTRRWKVQVLGYYGERDGAPVSALYKVRYAELFADRVGDTVEVTNLDGTAGGLTADPNKTSEFLDLSNGARTMLTPAAANASNAWQLGFRRDTIGANGGVGGPRGVTSIDFDDAATAGEALAQVKTRTADGEKARFDAINWASFEGKTLRGDRVISGFGDAWADRNARTPAYAAWVVTSAGGEKKYFIGFTSFENATATSPGTVALRIKPFKE
ncbi:HmuY family protein [Pendulispora rubella]|uniref:HmuY family protein n=1 Tax=Pendulispora rubella TaxID=2741070 RepID=A0ABZ2KZ55_9BACT